MNKKIAVLIIAGIAIAFFAQGCTASSRTTMTETVTTETAGNTASLTGNQGNFSSGNSSLSKSGTGAEQVEKKTVVKEERSTTASGGGGIISSTLNLIGSVLAFPFKVIGGALEAIF